MTPFCRISFMLLLACVCSDVGFAHKVAPTSIGSYWSGSLTAGSEVTFSGAGSSDNDTQDGGYVPRWHWDFDYQGTFVEDANTVSSLVSHVYAQGGAYTVAVRYDDNDNQAGNIYTFGVRIYDLKRYYYVKDHLGSIRSTVKGGELLVADGFSGDLSKWTVTSGSGFAIEGGELSCSTSGANTLVNSSSKVLTDGIITVDVKSVGGSSHDPNVIVRYQDPNNFYFVRPIGGVIQIYERLGGSYYNRASGGLDSVIESDRFYRLQIVVEGATISAYWKNGATPIVTWTDGTPWLSGKVGFFGFGGRHAHWDNMTVTTGGPGEVVVAENYDAWGQVLEGQSLNQGMSDTRYKYTGKERDVESQYDYFGARYYDARIGRWLVVDPLAEKYPAWSPYAYVHDNPLLLVDPNGRDVEFHESARSNSNFNKARDLYMKTDLGSKQMERFRKDHSILVVYEVGDISKSAGGTIAGITDWKTSVWNDSRGAYSTTVGSAELGIKDQVFQNKGKAVITIILDKELLQSMTTQKGSETIYHEGKAHIEYDRDKGDTSGEAVDVNTEHTKYGSKSVNGPAKKGSPADKFRRQAAKAEEKEEEEK